MSGGGASGHGQLQPTSSSAGAASGAGRVPPLVVDHDPKRRRVFSKDCEPLPPLPMLAISQIVVGSCSAVWYAAREG